MRIGVNCFLLKKDIGGMKQYFHRLFKELLENDKDNSYVFLYFEHNRDELLNLGTDKWKDRAILLRNQDEVHKHLDKIDLYFCPFGAIWPRPVPKPSVVTVHDIQEQFFPQFFTKEALWSRDYHYKPSMKVADRIITVSNFSKDSIVRIHGIPAEKIDVAYNVADNAYNKDSGGTEKQIPFPLPDKYIFYPANRWLHKNHDNLLKALVVLKKEKGMAVNCVFTGYDSLGGYSLQEKIDEYGLADQIRIIGYVSAEELNFIYRNAAMLCFPSLFEGFGMPLVEAMASGCPVACSNTTSIPEVVGNAALLFDPTKPNEIADRIFRILSDNSLSDELRKKGLEQAKIFSVKKMAAIHKEVFEKTFKAYKVSHFFYYRYFYEPLNKTRMRLKR